MIHCFFLLDLFGLTLADLQDNDVARYRKILMNRIDDLELVELLCVSVHPV